MRYSILIIFVVLWSCQPTEDHGHAHDEEGGHSHDDPSSVSYTIWTDNTELFVEFPSLVVGKVSRFAAHFTKMEGHQPVKVGSVSVSLIKGNKGIRSKVDSPSSPGIFSPSLQPTEAGTYQLIFELKTPEYADRIVLEDITVYANSEEAQAAIDEEDGNLISFLKEQAWKMEFQTGKVERKSFYEVVETAGVWRVSPSDNKVLAASSSGVVSISSTPLTKGLKVRKGQVLMTISSNGLSTNNLGAEINKAKITFEQAQAEYERKEQLFSTGVVPKSEMELVEQKYEVARTNYQTLSAGYQSGGKQVIAPFNGYVKSIFQNQGQFVDQGDPLMAIANHTGNILEVQMSPRYGSKLHSVSDIWFQPSEGDWKSLEETGGKVLSYSREVETDSPMLSVFAETTVDILMPEGSYTSVQVGLGEPKNALVIPESSLMEDYGKYSVIVQVSGESFESRQVTIGGRNGDEVEVLNGLEAGEMVVIKGAFQVKMASMSGQAPAHGHAH